jgi:cysteine desulfurase
MHSFGGQVGAAVQDARAQVAALLGAEETEIIFNSCGSEGNNTAIHAALAAQPDKRHIVTTAVEHPPFSTCASTWRKRATPSPTCRWMGAANWT